MDLKEASYQLGLFLPHQPSLNPEASCPAQSSSRQSTTSKREVKGARRVRNACLQCRERKIRCSRTYPCKGCVARGDGTKCDWDGGFASGNVPVYQKRVAEQRREVDKLNDRISSTKNFLETLIGQCSCKGAPAESTSCSHPASGARQMLEWFPTSTVNQPPDSAASHSTTFSTASVTTGSSGSQWTSEESISHSPLTTGSYLSEMKNDSPRGFRRPRNPSGYRSWKLLKEAREQQNFTKPRSVSGFGLRPITPRARGSTIRVPLDKELQNTIETTPQGEIFSLPEGLAYFPHHFSSNAESCFASHEAPEHLHGDAAVIHQFPLVASAPLQSSSLSSIQPCHGAKYQSLPPERASSPINSARIESDSPALNRYNPNFSVPYIIAPRTGGHAVSNLRQELHRRPASPRPHLGGSDPHRVSHTDTFTFPDLPWNYVSSGGPEQGVRANVPSRINEQGTLLPSSFGLGPVLGASRTTMYPQEPHWNPFSS